MYTPLKSLWCNADGFCKLALFAYRLINALQEQDALSRLFLIFINCVRLAAIAFIWKFCIRPINAMELGYHQDIKYTF